MYKTLCHVYLKAMVLRWQSLSVGLLLCLQTNKIHYKTTRSSVVFIYSFGIYGWINSLIFFKFISFSVYLPNSNCKFHKSHIFLIIRGVRFQNLNYLQNKKNQMLHSAKKTFNQIAKVSRVLEYFYISLTWAKTIQVNKNDKALLRLLLE